MTLELQLLNDSKFSSYSVTRSSADGVNIVTRWQRVGIHWDDLHASIQRRGDTM